MTESEGTIMSETGTPFSSEQKSMLWTEVAEATVARFQAVAALREAFAAAGHEWNGVSSGSNWKMRVAGKSALSLAPIYVCLKQTMRPNEPGHDPK
jgi:hypothetical protein